MKRTVLIFSLVLFWTVNTALAQSFRSTSKAGTTAAQFLKIGAGARPIGMGGAYTAIADDINSIYWNPAGLALIGGGGEATFNHAEWLGDTQYDFAAFSLNASDFGSLGLQVISLRTPEENVRTVFAPEGTGQVWDYNAIAIGVTFAKNLTDRFAIGFTGKFIQENLFNETAKGAAFDIGILYKTPFENVTLGASIINFGTKMRLDGRDIFFNEDPFPEQGSVNEVPSKFRLESYEIPLSLRFGLSWQLVHNEDVTILAAVDGSHPNDNVEFINGGVEVGLKNILFLRGGYKSLFLKNSEQGATFGAGLRYDIVGTNLKFDFGWADYGRLKNVKFVSLAIRY
ncbi:PorV/PorQ family protein [candidate division KSB1 bacterium]|nr:PorV/PorQ family protein [candidate division KSB1 bacterium]TDJ00663.1 MAG: PorV/PorQ family protein [Caldithrix sp.]